MFNDLYARELQAEKDLAFIAESVMEDLLEEEDDVDTESIDQAAIDKVDAAIDAIVSKADYDDTDLEDLLDDDDDIDDEELIEIMDEVTSEMTDFEI